MAELDIRLEDWASAELKSGAADFHHAPILFCKWKALKIVLTNKEGEGFEAWRALVNKYEPTNKASVVGKLAEILRTPFEGDLLDALTTFERKIMIYEAQSRETISFPENWLRHCQYWPEQHERTPFDERHEVRQLDKFLFERLIEHTRKTITAPTPMDLDAFQGNCHKCGKYGHTAKECRSSSHGEAEKASLHNVERNIMDSVGQGFTHHPIKIHRKEDGKVTEKETAREPRRVASPKEEKTER